MLHKENRENFILILCYFAGVIKPKGASEYLWNLADEKISANQRKEIEWFYLYLLDII